MDGDRRYSLFRSAEQLAAFGAAAFWPLGIPQRKTRAILAVAREIVAGTLDQEALAAPGDADLVARRLQVTRGIGPWTAHHVIIRGIGMTDCLPTEDPRLLLTVAELYGPTPSVGAAQLRARRRTLASVAQLRYLLFMEHVLRIGGLPRF